MGTDNGGIDCGSGWGWDRGEQWEKGRTTLTEHQQKIKIEKNICKNKNKVAMFP